MESVIQAITDWIHDMLVTGVMDTLTGMFDAVNDKVGVVATNVGMNPANFSPGIYSLIRGISESVIIPISVLILTFVACYELIQMIIDHNNLANFETWFFFRWVFKTFIAVMLITNTFDITLAVFDVAQHVINSSGGIISSSTVISADAIAALQSSVESMEIGGLFGLWFQANIIKLTLHALSAFIFVIVYGRMIEIYLMISLAPIPFATFGNKEQSQIGQNYLRAICALAFQGFLILICVGIYAVLIQTIVFTSDIVGSLWGVLGYSILLCFTLFKTGTLAKSIFSAH